jgi:hypothetical protein
LALSRRSGVPQQRIGSLPLIDRYGSGVYSFFQMFQTALKFDFLVGLILVYAAMNEPCPPDAQTKHTTSRGNDRCRAAPFRLVPYIHKPYKPHCCK